MLENSKLVLMIWNWLIFPYMVINFLGATIGTLEALLCLIDSLSVLNERLIFLCLFNFLILMLALIIALLFLTLWAFPPQAPSDLTELGLVMRISFLLYLGPVILSCNCNAVVVFAAERKLLKNRIKWWKINVFGSVRKYKKEILSFLTFKIEFSPLCHSDKASRESHKSSYMKILNDDRGLESLGSKKGNLNICV